MAVMTEYDFTQQVDYPDALVSNIQASSISTPLVSIQTNGVGNAMEVAVFFQDALSSADQATLNSVMAAYVNEIPSSQLGLLQIKQDMSFGLNLIAQFGAANRAAGLSTAQVAQISQQLSPIQSLLLSGSLQTALTVIQSLTPTALLTQDTINAYATEIQNYLTAQGSS